MINIFKVIKNRIKRLPEIKEIKDTLIEMSTFLNSQGVRVLYVELPNHKKIKNLTPFEWDRIKNWSFDFNKYKEELPKLKQIYGENVTQEYILSVFDGGIVVQGEKRKVLLDFESEHQHIINGRRITTGQPDHYKNTIYTHGACTWRGTGVEDQETIASFLQEKINQKYPNCYKVVNSAIGRASTIFDDFEVIKEQLYKPGDIVIIGSHGLITSIRPSFFLKHGFGYISTSPLFDRPHNYGEWFNDSTLHTNKRGNKVISQKIFDTLQELTWLTTGVSSQKETGNEMANSATLLKGNKIYGDNPELLKFVNYISQYRKGDDTSINGSIVMNCNPFTLGHRYLIEYASSKVDNLYIFVVQENKSYFPFEDRFRLVQQGTADLKNVTVLPSGNFIISATTFPGYFYKDNLKEAKIDCSNDLNVFAEYIAPSLNIKVRFAGQEPLDQVTRQYNEGMEEILPQHGIEFCEIPRKEDEEGTGVISASRVRKLLKENNFEQLKKLVPPTTLEYLCQFKQDNEFSN